MTADSKTLADRVKDVAYTEGDFTLRSGRQSHYIIDKYAFETRPALLKEIAREMAALMPEGVDRLAGVELGGVPLATALAIETGLDFVIVRKGAKGYGLDRPFEGDLNAGENIAVVEDVCTTGGAALQAIEVLRDAGVGTITLLAVVDRQEGAAEAFAAADVDFRPILTRDSMGIEPD